MERHGSLSIALAALAATATGCGPKFTSPTDVADLRILAVRAEPPELAPPGDASAPTRSALGALVGHPAFATDATLRATVLHVACTPVPGQAEPSPCTVLAELASPQGLVGLADPGTACTAPGLGVPGAITLAGLESCGRDGCEPVVVRRDPADPGSEVTLPVPAYEVPAALDLGSLPPGNPERVLGVEVMDLALALAVDPADLGPDTAVASDCEALGTVASRFAAGWDAGPHVLALKRLRVRGPDAPSAPNRNPPLDGIALDGALLPPPSASPYLVAPGEERALTPVLPGDEAALREAYLEVDGAGNVLGEKTEEWTYSWFAAGGELSDLHTRSATQPEVLTTPPSGRAVVWLVVRDLRGGVAWTSGLVTATP